MENSSRKTPIKLMESSLAGLTVKYTVYLEPLVVKKNAKPKTPTNKTKSLHFTSLHPLAILIPGVRLPATHQGHFLRVKKKSRETSLL